MNTTKIIKAAVGDGRYTVTAPIVKEDYGIYLKIEGVSLPEVYEIDFSNEERNGTSVTMIGNSDGVLIPNQFIKSGEDIFAFLYHVGEDYGRTVYKFRIPNKLRPDRTNEQPTPEEQSTIDQAISALNSAVEQTAQDVVTTGRNASRSESARDDAESAQTAAEAAQTAAEMAESHAQGYAASASDSATAAARSAENASTSASLASASADRAEQSAAQSGYMWFYIEDGKLYLDRTPNTQVDFFMQDGKLYVEEVV